MTIETYPSTNYPDRLSVKHKFHSDSNTFTVIDLTPEDVAQLKEALLAKEPAASHTVNVAAGERTLYPADQFTQQVLKKLPNDTAGRALIRLADPSVINNEEWTAAVDLITGMAIQVRRTDCGLGCKCAAEVTLA